MHPIIVLVVASSKEENLLDACLQAYNPPVTPPELTEVSAIVTQQIQSHYVLLHDTADSQKVADKVLCCGWRVDVWMACGRVDGVWTCVFVCM